MTAPHPSGAAGDIDVVVVAAVARNGAIGRDNRLVFSDAADQRHFRATTIGAPVVMGRRTWDSLPARMRPLPGRPNIVLTRDRGWQAPGANTAASWDEALGLARSGGAARVSVIGGAAVYAAALPLATRLVLTEVDAEPDADTFFPPWDRSLFVEDSREPNVTPDGVRFDFVVYRRR